VQLNKPSRIGVGIGKLIGLGLVVLSVPSWPQEVKSQAAAWTAAVPAWALGIIGGLLLAVLYGHQWWQKYVEKPNATIGSTTRLTLVDPDLASATDWKAKEAEARRHYEDKEAEAKRHYELTSIRAQGEYEAKTASFTASIGKLQDKRAQLVRELAAIQGDMTSLKAQNAELTLVNDGLRRKIDIAKVSASNGEAESSELARLKSLADECEQRESARGFRDFYGAPVITNWNELDAYSRRELRRALYGLHEPTKLIRERIISLCDSLAQAWSDPDKPEHHLAIAWQPFVERVSRCEQLFADEMQANKDARQSFLAFLVAYERLKSRLTAARRFCHLNMQWQYWEKDDLAFAQQVKEAASRVEEFREIMDAFKAKGVIDAVLRPYDPPQSASHVSKPSPTEGGT
jgi:hypothetical protein